MRLLAQHGYGDGQKITEGLTKGYIEGVIYSPRDIGPEALIGKLTELRGTFGEGPKLLFDPQLYVSLYGNNPNVNIGKLVDYTQYFEFKRRSFLEREDNIKSLLRKSFEFQKDLPISFIISPNILISRSFDSRESVISKNFIRLAKEILNEYNIDKPLFVSLIISRDALANKLELQEFLNDITLLDTPPDGFYLLVASRSSEARTDIFNTNVIAGWMMLNYSLKVNGYEIINGYSDLLSPFLGAVGGDYGATGWWSNLRSFSMDRFIPSSRGGRLPIQRYLSKVLLNRITHIEYNSWKQLYPIIVNNLETDRIYENEEPDRSKEILQSWESLKSLLEELTRQSIRDNLVLCEQSIRGAMDVYTQINLSFRPDPKSNNEHLEALVEGIKAFRLIAEV